MVGIKHVAERAGVSIGTVSNVLNRPAMVAPVTRQRVLEAITELGYVRNEQARALRAGRSRTVGLVVLDVANPFFTDVAAGVEQVADEHGIVITLCNSSDQRERERRHLALLAEQRVQGVLITPVDAREPELDTLVGRGIPVVLVDRSSGDRRRCSVAVDDVLGGRLVGEHLLEQGHRRVAFLGGPLSLTQLADRRRGLALALGAGPVPVEPLVLETEALSIVEGARAGQRIAAMPAPERPTAVACGNDLVALGLLQGLTTAGLRVPHDVAVVGYDDIIYAAAAAVPLSSVRQPREALGRAAAELLFSEIDQPQGHQHQQLLFAPELVVRASSAEAPRTS